MYAVFVYGQLLTIGKVKPDKSNFLFEGLLGKMAIEQLEAVLESKVFVALINNLEDGSAFHIEGHRREEYLRAVEIQPRKGPLSS